MFVRYSCVRVCVFICYSLSFSSVIEIYPCCCVIGDTFLCIVKYHLLVWIYYSLLSYFLINGYLCCVQLPATVNGLVWVFRYKTFGKHTLSFLLGEWIHSNRYGHVISQKCVSFTRNCQLSKKFSFLKTGSAWVFYLLHFFAIVWYW